MFLNGWLLKSVVPTPSANGCLIRNDIIRRYVRSTDLSDRQFIHGRVGTIKYFLRILKTTPAVFNATNILVIRKFQSC